MSTTQDEYDQIRQAIMADRSYKNDDERLIAFKGTYQEMIHSEEAVAEWDMEFYPPSLKFESSFFLFFYIITNFFVYFYMDDMFIVSLTVLGFIFISPMLLMFPPICYKHKFTKSGFYVLKYKKGKKARKIIMILYLVLATFAVVYAMMTVGFMAFAGAGAGVLGLFSFITIVAKENRVTEAYFPWNGILIVDAENNRSFWGDDCRFDLNIYEVRTELKDYEKIKNLILGFIRSETYFTDTGYDFNSEKGKQANKILEKELPFYMDEYRNIDF
ncbi:hypothetical protein KCN56_09130 [Photobacterium galatheae]|uniref:hypothetical protein n=1 Tax=Photobacterium galatheae TaxID=1654360 RepID=UPI00202CDADA|nr:hypothetical protein [Photobacterium galatheae]MCM0148721.1 hypothetical protein [Photobacterium galatheae]